MLFFWSSKTEFSKPNFQVSTSCFYRVIFVNVICSGNHWEFEGKDYFVVVKVYDLFQWNYLSSDNQT